MRVKIELVRGVLIAFEGIDGAGKSTQARILFHNLRERGYQAILLHEPTASFFGRMIKSSSVGGRQHAFKELEYFLKDRREDVKNNINPALKAKMIVVMDRYYFSNIAYQGAMGIDPGKIRDMNEEFAPKPDLTIIIDVPPPVGLSRIRGRRLDGPNLFEEEEYLTSVRTLFKRLEDPFIKVINGTRESDEIADEILHTTLKILEPLKKYMVH